LLPGDRRPTELAPDLRDWPHLHARLAVVEAGAAPAVVNRAARPAGVFWVTAAASPSLPQPLRSGGPGRRYVVAPGRVGGPQGGAAVFTVAGCVGALHTARSRRRMGRAA
jgi:hypothetical protein